MGRVVAERPRGWQDERQARAAPPREAHLAAAWEERRYPPGGLVDSLGRRLHVVFPGRRWGGPGPDFRGALVALADGTLLRGDVEVHCRGSGWSQHGHAFDSRYEGVILHVVQEADAPALDRRGVAIPTVVLPPPALLAFPALAPCLRDAEEVRRLVVEAGRARFRAKSARFEADLTAVEASQVLWRGVAEALGYSCNVEPFGRLADAVPWHEARRIARERGVEELAAHLLAAAGLDDGPRGARSALALADAPLACRPGLAGAAWQRTQLRPRNDPARRCRGLAELAGRWAASADPPGKLVADLVRLAAAVRKPPLWAFVSAPPWIGRGRARAIVANVLLPYARAAGIAEAAGLFERAPGHPECRPTRYMAELLGLPARPPRTACEQQGLLALYASHCAGRVCEACPARGSDLLPTRGASWASA